jgi:hypothetical protein
MNQFQLSIMPVGACNMSCPNCTQTPWRADFSDYQMKLDEVRTICRRVNELGLHFTWAHITGGEPALWRNLYEGCRILSTSGAFDHVEVWSNCKSIKPLMRVLDDGVVEHVITQEANTYKAGAYELKGKYGDRMVIITPSTHQVHPDHPLDNVLPAECGCDRVEVFGQRVYPCANFYSNMRRVGLDPHDTRWSIPIYDNWAVFMDGVDRYNMPACCVCLANGKVSRQAAVGEVV